MAASEKDKTFVRTICQIHKDGGNTGDVAVALGYDTEYGSLAQGKSKVSAEAASFRKRGLALPKFKKGRQSVPLSEENREELELLM